MRVLAVAALLSSGAQAQTHYTCRDAGGNPLSGQFPPEQCVGEVCAINPNTGARTCSPPRETPAQKQLREEAARRQSECVRLAHQQLSDDLRFLDRYRNDEMIEDDRAREAVELHLRIAETNKRLEGLRATEKRLGAEAEFYGPKHPMPANLRNEIDSNRRLIAAQEAIAERLAKDVVKMNAKYDGFLKRRHDLIENGSKPMRCDEALAR